MIRLTTVVSCAVASALALTVPTRAQGTVEWQQEVRYEIDVHVQTDAHRLRGRQRVTYVNHSPDTLRQVFYHLYFNAFQPHSMMAERNRHLPDPDDRVVPRIFELGPHEVGRQEVRWLKQDGRAVEFHINDTVMQVQLARALPPGDSTELYMSFAAQVPLQTRRSGRDNEEGIDLSMMQWYPKVAAYDERGWHADPYVGREFYGPFGRFDVRLTLPAHYIVGATGTLRNPEQVKHGYDAGSGAAHATNGPDSLTWHFSADGVHDFAWAADPDYLHERFVGPRGIVYHLLYQPDVATTWRTMREWLPQLMAFFGDRIGPYPYPQFTVVQAGDGGMEYPMLIALKGKRSLQSLIGLVAHEAAHQWFYSILGSNEADFAWMDEGFTEFVSREAVAHLQGRESPRHVSAMMQVMTLHHLGLHERLNTPSDWFDTNTGYVTAAYSGGEMLLDLLGFVISDSLRDAFLKSYYQSQKFGHPDPHDVERVAERVSGIQLDWFFEQLLNAPDLDVDYAVGETASRRVEDEWVTDVTLHRRGTVVLPVDLYLVLEDGTTQWVNVPLAGMQGSKPVPDSWVVADPWFWTHPSYSLRVETPSRVREVMVDPALRTPDTNRLNNSSKLPINATFLRPARPSLTSYQVGYRPVVKYARNFGVGAGVQASGTYIFGSRQLRLMATVWPNVVRDDRSEGSPVDAIDYEASYSDALGARSRATVGARKHLGFMENVVSVERLLGRFPYLDDRRMRVTAAVSHQYAPTDRVWEYFDQNPFGTAHFLSTRLTYTLHEGADRLQVEAEVGGAPSAARLGASATRLVIDGTKSARYKGLRGLARFRAGIGAENLAFHKTFRLGAPSIERAWRNDAYRNLSGIFSPPDASGHFVAFAGAGPVAYAYAHPDPAGIAGISGNKIFSGSLSVAARPLPRSPYGRPLSVQLFAGAGAAWTAGGVLDGPAVGGILADAGAGFDYDLSTIDRLRRWIDQSDALKGMKIAARFPFWVSDPALLNDEADRQLGLRWLVGIQIQP